MPSAQYDENGQFTGAAKYPLETVKYFEFSFKGNGDREDTCFYVLPLLVEHLRANHPELTVLDLENRMLDDKQVSQVPALASGGFATLSFWPAAAAQALPVIKALKGNTTVTELKLARNMMDLALLELSEILKTNQTITKVRRRCLSAPLGLPCSCRAPASFVLLSDTPRLVISHPTGGHRGGLVVSHSRAVACHPSRFAKRKPTAINFCALNLNSVAGNVRARLISHPSLPPLPRPATFTLFTHTSLLPPQVESHLSGPWSHTPLPVLTARPSMPLPRRV
jgi:hypothetical protein